MAFDDLQTKKDYRITVRKGKGGDGRLTVGPDFMLGSDHWAFALKAANPGADSDHINNDVPANPSLGFAAGPQFCFVCKGHPF